MLGWTTESILKNVDNYVAQMDAYRQTYKRNSTLYIREVCSDIAIFDWFKPQLSYNRLKEMQMFLRVAMGYDFKGYVCFKVGSAGTANGMWAYKEETTNGFSPEGVTLYRSFSTEDKPYWRIQAKNKVWYPERDAYNSIHTRKDLDNLIKELQKQDLL